jgi:oligopeptide/dipeptide ABC transporter ATP-binding protein
MTKKVVVLYAGRVAESADTLSIYTNPKHPYTAALLQSVPRVDRKKNLIPIPGNIPNLITPPSGCRFHPRCSYMIDKCAAEMPGLEPCGEGRQVACFRWKDLTLGKGS